jgi:hypothetical protein
LLGSHRQDEDQEEQGKLPHDKHEILRRRVEVKCSFPKTGFGYKANNCKEP